jgi:hypothetical protein
LRWDFIRVDNIRNVPSSQLKDRIRELHTRAIAATGDDLHAILAELKAALHQHSEDLRKEAAAKLKRT